ncbi:MAG: glutamine-hydrolyzing carbamoyl-phosphate synthase small subunit [Thermoproteota archaeon]|nr:glutamine-hydrolyzing carbamoyl-phosphate synthase small subunit [Thermoproteota archaeon]
MGFGYPNIVGGEVVFNTGMVGYTETLTDPSYRGQILCMTYPLIGNYGVPRCDNLDEFGLPRHFESEKIQVNGMIVNELSTVASHWDCERTLDQWLYDEKVSGISGIDTRDLTKRLRLDGVMRGVLSVSSEKIDSYGLASTMRETKYDGFNFVPEVSLTKSREYGNHSLPPVVLIDTGVKYSIIRNILRIGFRVICVPWDTSSLEILSYRPKGVIISNGPGDPKMCKETIKTTNDLINSSVPILGICLGNQIVALAAGGDTHKLKFGHRGQNKACTDVETNRTFITSQNHGYSIEPKSLHKTGFDIWYINADDKTIEGIIHRSKPVIAVQFHPEASPGPYDCMFVFEKFKDMILNDSTRYQGETNEPLRTSARTGNKGKKIGGRKGVSEK